MGAGRDGVIGAALIEGQGTEGAAFFGSVGLDRLEHRSRIGHLGHDLGIDEAGDFQLFGTAIDHTADVLDLDIGRNELRVVLPTITGAAFLDMDLFRKWHELVPSLSVIS